MRKFIVSCGLAVAALPVQWSTFALGTAVVALGAAQPAHAQLKTAGNPDDVEIWKKMHSSLFDNRKIVSPAEDIVQLDAPGRAEDAAIVPISIKTQLPSGGNRRIEKLYLLIDNNPSPLAAVFHFASGGGARADIETRVRIDEYTHVRAIAETNDGQLFMTTRFVKASGGCSAPPGKDAQAALASLGKMKVRIEGNPADKQPLLAQLMISHPNHSGLAMDQLTRQYTPPHFVRKIDVSYGGKPVLSADVDFSISENPNFRFHFVPQGEGELKAVVVDSNDLKFESSFSIRGSL